MTTILPFIAMFLIKFNDCVDRCVIYDSHMSVLLPNIQVIHSLWRTKTARRNVIDECVSLISSLLFPQFCSLMSLERCDSRAAGRGAAAGGCWD